MVKGNKCQQSYIDPLAITKKIDKSNFFNIKRILKSKIHNQSLNHKSVGGDKEQNSDIKNELNGNSMV